MDDKTDGYASYFMINCAHPDHSTRVLEDGGWLSRLGGIVANASRCGQAELDEAEVLDDGDPIELGQQMASIVGRHRGIVGCCCGTDGRHLAQIASAVRDSSSN